jgi:hypothetical protein
MNHNANTVPQERRIKQLASFFLGSSILLILFTFQLPSNEEMLIIQHLLVFNFNAIDPLYFTVFSLMGIWPLVQTSLLFSDGKNKRVSVWPFLLLSFLSGAYVLSIYLILRDTQKPGKQVSKLDSILISTPWLIFLLISTLALGLFGFLFGNLANYTNAVTKYLFIRVMTIDFILFTVITPMTIYIHSINNSVKIPSKLPFLGLIPILGAVFYLAKYSRKREDREEKIMLY